MLSKEYLITVLFGFADLSPSLFRGSGVKLVNVKQVILAVIRVKTS